MSSTSSLSLGSVTSLSTSPSTQGSPVIKHGMEVELQEEDSESQSVFEGNNEYLEYLEPNPVLPPDYNDLPPGGYPKFPIIDSPAGAEPLPDYTPAVYKIGCVCRKLEWINPYEPATSRSWKTVIMEVNSTQLNFYSIPHNLESYMLQFKPMKKLRVTPDFKHFNSSITSEYDYQFYKHCQSLDLFKKLIRSYSLQHCKIGLAVDYKKRMNVLRVRAETEQMLIYFTNTNDLINWNLAINIGKDLSIDLNDRELPKYRTVPRRRRNRLYGTMNSSGIEDYYSDIRRGRSSSDPVNLVSKLSKLKLRFKRNSVPNLTNLIIKEMNEVEIDSFDGSSVVSSSMTSIADANSIGDGISFAESSAELSRDSIEDASIRDPRDDDEDVDDISDLHSDDEDDDDPEISRLKKSTLVEAFIKWNPYSKPQSEKRYYKNCLRCIKPLNGDDSWVSKDLVKVSKDEFGKIWVKEFIVGSHGLIPK